jgi:hypothetical protein
MLSVVGCVSEKSAESRVNAYPMNDMTVPNGHRSNYSEKFDSPYTNMRKFLLAVYIIIIILLTIIMILITVLAPIEAYWEMLQDKM